MCTILFLFRVNPSFPLIIAANRDEFYARKATEPKTLSSSPKSIGGIDSEKKGTWMGVNSHALFVGITNQRTNRLSDPSLQSRGQVVRRLLRCTSIDEMLTQLKEIDPRQYNPFNLLFGSAEKVNVAYSRRDAPNVLVEEMEKGVYVLANDRIGSARFPKAFRVQQRAVQVSRYPWSELKGELIEIMADHFIPPLKDMTEIPDKPLFKREIWHQLQAVCIHTEFYGTCSATLIALEKNRVAHYLFAKGPPCCTPFKDMTYLLNSE